MASEAVPSVAQTRPPLWRDVRVLRVLFQVVVLAAVGLVLFYLAGNFTRNAARINLDLGFGFLDQPAGIDIRDSDFRPTQPIRDALVVGFVNTIRIAGVGIVVATILGIAVGVARLSTNWLVRKAAAVYVETLRNIPILVIILFTYTAVVLKFPPINEAVEWVGIVVFSNRGLNVPWFDPAGPARLFVVLLLLGFVVANLVGWWRTRRFDATGQPHHRVAYGFLTLVVIAAAAYVALGGPVTISLPARDGRVVSGGIGLGPEYAAALMALFFYTASHVAEIVRGSILAVPKGQTEAANALALTGFQRLRYVILPQALRIMIPPLGNQYLNLTKNSSLAAFIGYFELTRVGINTVANGRPAPQVYLLVMLGYLTLSVFISLIANIVNRQLALETR